jgi:hypothetical protein
MKKMILKAVVIMLLIAFGAISVRKLERIQNERQIVGTWVSGSEKVFTFQDNGILTVIKDMPDVGLSSGEASYDFVYTNAICITQGDASVELEMKVGKPQLIIYFMGQEYLSLQKE